MISKSVPRAVLADLMMPGGMSGYELIARLRSDPRTEQTPILVVTGKDMTPDDRKLILGQITEVIRKGDLLMSDLEPRLRETLEYLGVRPTHGEDSPG
jgi:CheY-like chemotaxis protein